MNTRLNLIDHGAAVIRGLASIDTYARGTNLSINLYHLIKLRVSQINGCAFCVDMHAREAKQADETDERLHALVTWRESPYFTEPERAALELAEAGTRLADRENEAVTDEIWAQVTKHFDDETTTALVATIAAINAWNRIGVITRPPVGANNH